MEHIGSTQVVVRVRYIEERSIVTQCSNVEALQILHGGQDAEQIAEILVKRAIKDDISEYDIISASVRALAENTYFVKKQGE